MPALDALPLRDQPTGLAVPPARMPLFHARRPLKRWRYVGLFGEEAMLCAARVTIGGLPQSFHAVWDRRRLRERTQHRRGVALDGVVRFPGADLRWEPDGEPMEVTSRHGASYIWTRKQPVRATGMLDGRRVALRGLLDDSAGYHARATAWRWCAGVGEALDGTPVAWNLVTGVHDAERASERTVWVGGRPTEAAPCSFAEDLSCVRWPGGEELHFAEEARRTRHEDLRVVASDYVQPFGTFSGTLPGGVGLARGWGVMERHEARW